MKANTAQLNAISRSITARNQKKAVKELAEKGIDFDLFRETCGYRGSPCRLLNDIKANTESTMLKVQFYKDVQSLMDEVSDE